MKNRYIFALLAILAFNWVLISPELDIGRSAQNDHVLHWMLIQDIAQAKHPLDVWSPTVAMGEPITRLYQPGAHLIVVGIWRVLYGMVPLMTVFLWVHFLSLVLLPLSFYACARLLRLSESEALGAAMLSWLISGDTWGLDIGSYAWAGHGLFPQAVAAHFLLLTVGAGWVYFHERARGRFFWLLPTFLAVLTGYCNLLYGYVGTVTLAVMWAFGWRERRCRLLDLARIAIVAGAAASPKLLAWWQDRTLSGDDFVWRSSKRWMMEGLGASVVMKQLLTGELLDHGRLPVISLLALLGIVLCFRASRHSTVRVFMVVGLTLFTLLSFGSVFWGKLILLAGIIKAFQIHRLVGAMDVFLVLLSGAGLAWLGSFLYRRYGSAVAAVTLLLILAPCVQDRMSRMSRNAATGYENLSAQAAYADDIQAVLAVSRERGGRAYAGSFGRGNPQGWGLRTGVGHVPFFSTLTASQIPNIGFYYLGLIEGNNTMVTFDDHSEQSYLDFNVRTVISYVSWEAPAFLKSHAVYGNFAVWDAPGKGYFDNSISETNTSQSYAATVDHPEPCDVLLRACFHWNWHATVDAKPTPIRKADNGFMLIPVAAGRHEISVRYN
jgi:hypothetical protein